ncbi:hypothetical protein CBS101457_005024 [Exobasidium rhododendri]|nr:hypothetical protein CBS101457_005024 [Exobasidium rhododendri]
MSRPANTGHSNSHQGSASNASSYFPKNYSSPATSISRTPTEEPFKNERGAGPKRAGKEWLPYRGPPSLIIAIDLGTTFSGASYCILTPGQKPKIEDVKSYPGQATSGSKVPSVILYSSDGKPALFGAEAVDGAAASKVLDQGGAAARWWKLYLKPSHLELIVDLESAAPDMDPLPFGVTAETIAAQFLSYMVSCVGAYIQSRHSNGGDVLAQMAESISYVITIPNGWELPQQQVLRNACIEAGMVSQDRASTISFVSEAEASMNFCAQSSAASDWLEYPGQHLIVCDAGGGTIDISTYEVKSTAPTLSLSETSASDCLMAGSTTVDRRARELIQRRLAGTEWDNAQDLEDFQARFCSSIKETFSDKGEEQYLAIGTAGLNRDELQLRRGKLIFSGNEIASLYEPSIRVTEASIRARIHDSSGITTTIAMVGGFSESVYFRKELQARLGDLVQLCKPDEATSKAVANGAVAWLIDGVVATRVSRMTYGIRCSTVYKGNNPSHIARARQKFTGNDGKVRLPSSFGTVLQKGESGREDEEFLESFSMTWMMQMQAHKEVSLIVYRGDEDKPPEFVDEGGFEDLCKFRVDMEPFRPVMPVKTTPDGQQYISARIKLAMKLNGTEISAQVLFNHEGQIFRGPVSVFADLG